MQICLVTDRRRLVQSGATEPTAVRCLLAQVRHAVEAGVDLVEVRERDLEARALAALVRDVLSVARGTRTRVVVNDRIDVALACGADGVHLRSDSIGVHDVRRLVPRGFLVGRSVHAMGDVAAAQGADYLIAGTVFRSASKDARHELLGVDGLRAIAAAASAPVLAIGGIALDRMEQVAGAGAAGIAAIGFFMLDHQPTAIGCRACALTELVALARAKFDSVISRP